MRLAGNALQNLSYPAFGFPRELCSLIETGLEGLPALSALDFHP